MIFRSLLRDCLVLNWALPLSSLPPLPEPLRYQIHPWNDGPHVFASALLFRHERLRLDPVPLVRISYPQLSLRLCVLDGDGAPAVLFRSILVPGWVLPSVRLVAGQPARLARFSYPRPSKTPEAAGWRWQVTQKRSLVVEAAQGSPGVGTGPDLGSWENTTGYFHDRRSGYVLGGGGFRQVVLSPRPTALWPMKAEVDETGLLVECLPDIGTNDWPPLHSAWLCPEIASVFEMGPVVELGKLRRTTPSVATDPAMFGSQSGDQMRSLPRFVARPAA
jgi:hypothetical protein